MRLISPGPAVMHQRLARNFVWQAFKIKKFSFEWIENHDNRNFKRIQSIPVGKPPRDPHPCQD